MIEYDKFQKVLIYLELMGEFLRDATIRKFRIVQTFKLEEVR